MNIKTIGILGSGQLGRMIAIAAAEMGVRAHIFAPDAIGSPAAEVAHSATQADYTDEAALKAFAASIDCVTSEFENVPAAAMLLLAEYFPASPGRKPCISPKIVCAKRSGQIIRHSNAGL